MALIRIQKLLADAGYCSRRKAEALIREGRVQRGGRPVKLGDKASPKDLITVDGQRVSIAAKKHLRYIMLHKPRGYVTTLRDDRGRPTVAELTREESRRLERLEEIIHSRVVGQEAAVSAVCRAVRLGRAGLSDPKRPVGRFLFL